MEFKDRIILTGTRSDLSVTIHMCIMLVFSYKNYTIQVVTSLKLGTVINN